LTATELILRDPLGERTLSASDFPVSLGGAGHTVVLPGAGENTLAWIALHDGQLFLQPAEGREAPLVNGAPVRRATWLREGDVVDVGQGRLRVSAPEGVRLVEVEDGSGGNLTVPPEAPTIPVVTGGGDEDEERIETVAFRRPATQRGVRRNTAVRLAGAAAVALLALVAWFFATGRAVTIVSQPDGDVRLRGGFSLGVGQNHFARPGRYVVEIEREGYAPLRTPITVADAANQRFTFRLRKLPGRLLVQSTVTGRASLAGKDLGAVPGELRVPPGRHQLVLTAPRHLPYSAPVDIVGENRRQTLVAKFVPAWGVVTVLTEPTGAQIDVDGKAAGTTPAKLELDAGTHRIELRQPGFKDWETDLQVVANEPQTLGPVRLGLPDGTLIVRTVPAGASVSVGGAYRGRSPLTLEVRPDVPLAIVATRDGYEPATNQTTVGSGARREVSLSLAPILGEVTVQAEPAGAEVYTNGRSAGRAGEVLRLPSARQELEVRLAGHRPYRTTITPRPGLPQVISVRLEPGRGPAIVAPTAGSGGATAGAATAAATASAALSPTIRAKSGAELRLLGPANYTMGSPRRESGRRANEAQRPVELRRRFYLDTHEVTNAEYKQFRPQHRSGFLGQSTLELDRQPVVNVSWQDAAEYCNWLSQQEGLPPAYQSQGGKLVPVTPATTGYRLATEAEWEWAARANRDGSLRKYPWGDTLPVPAGAGNFGDRQAQPLLQAVLADLDDGNVVTANVGSFAPNVLGFYDMGGNVSEWTTDLYTVQPPGSAVATDPLAAAPGNVHVIRGSSWRHATVTELRAAYRDYGEGRRNDLGFRIARYAEMQ
jgi:formylglycine-generating enzyme required for sulfatase activity